MKRLCGRRVGAGGGRKEHSDVHDLVFLCLEILDLEFSSRLISHLCMCTTTSCCVVSISRIQSTSSSTLICALTAT
jgi:hypothetical protein